VLQQVLGPLHEYMDRKAVQSSMDQFVIAYGAKNRFAAIKSKRMARAIQGLVQERGEGMDEGDEVLVVDEQGNPMPLTQAVGQWDTAKQNKREQLKQLAQQRKLELKQLKQLAQHQEQEPEQKPQRRSTRAAPRKRQRRNLVQDPTSSSSASSEDEVQAAAAAGAQRAARATRAQRRRLLASDDDEPGAHPDWLLAHDSE
jgi:hypothetical protein